jgi:predicted dehydrogenase
MRKSKKLGVALLGACAGISRNNYIPAILRKKELEIRCMMDVQKDALEQLSKEYNCDVSTKAEDAVSREDIDLVCITSPDALHCEHVITAANAGKHIICTKPLALNIKEAEKMRKVLRKNKGLFMCGMNMRWSAWTQAVKKAMETEKIGKPVFVRWINKGDFFPYPQGHFYRTAKSGGQLLHNGAHYLDAMSYWIDSMPSSVHGVSTKNVMKNDPIEFDNYHNLSIEYESGALGQLEYNQLLVNPRGYPSVTMATVIGTEGMIDISLDDSRTVEVYSEGKVSFQKNIPKDNSGFDAMISDFTNAIIEGKETPLPFEHSMRILECCLNGGASCKNGKVYKLAG